MDEGDSGPTPNFGEILPGPACGKKVGQVCPQDWTPLKNNDANSVKWRRAAAGLHSTYNPTDILKSGRVGGVDKRGGGRVFFQESSQV